VNASKTAALRPGLIKLRAEAKASARDSSLQRQKAHSSCGRMSDAFKRHIKAINVGNTAVRPKDGLDSQRIQPKHPAKA
jgi:hypothetical protein